MLRGFAKGGGSGTPARPTRVTNRRPSGLVGNVSTCWRRILTSSGDAGTGRVSLTPRCFSWRSSFAWPESVQAPLVCGVDPSRTSSPQPDLGSRQILDAKMPRLCRAESGVVQTGEVSLEGWVRALHCGQECPGLSWIAVKVSASFTENVPSTRNTGPRKGA